ncbi:Ycf66 family protein [Calothrix parasitica NIES-267]|uniref:Ycf66 family protein n=1 Tax=Calothrix parasitica NIES-267 TaxID=1973488 RepID=A0A1Z4LUT0_9CYAN|nr:Ycf66 family protein [Calothrix parasitica NIES-267]
MFYFSQVNIGINLGANFASWLGFIQIIFGLFYLIFAIVKLIPTRSRLSRIATIFYIIQLIILPPLLLLSGIILVFQGWRLDPILQFQQLILSALIFYLR